MVKLQTPFKRLEHFTKANIFLGSIKRSSFQNGVSNFDPNNINLLRTFGVNVLVVFCKLDHFSAVEKKSVML